MESIEDQVRAWAKGMYAIEAGVELLIRMRGVIREDAPWITSHGNGRASVDVEVLRDEAGAWSGGEQRLVNIAISLMGGGPADLNDDLSGLDRRGLRLVLAAASHANGSHEQSDLVFDEDGQPRIKRVGSLWPWPTDNT